MSGERGSSRSGGGRGRPSDNWKGVGSYGTIGIELVLSIIFGFAIGRWLDGKLGTDPWMTFIWTGFGIAAAVRALVRVTREMKAEAEREEREKGNPLPVYEDRRDEEERRAKEERDAPRAEDDGPGKDGENGASGGPDGQS